MTELTICSVSYLNKDCLDLNYFLTKSLNPQAQFKWIVVENNPLDFDQRISLTDDRFVGVEGAAPQINGRARGSYHHAAALNKALEFVETRFVLVLDPDYFIVRGNWINNVINDMQQHGLAILGSPYHPQYHKFYRYAPSAACVFIDLNEVNKTRLDFRPEFEGFQAINEFSRKDLIKLLLGSEQHLRQIHPEATREMAQSALIDKFLRPFQRDILKKTKYTPGSLRDTGIRLMHISKQLRSNQVECFVPAWVNPNFSSTNNPQTILEHFWWRWLVPERLSLYPKRRSYTATTFFRDFGLPNIDGLGWEEYFWRGQPFSFHLRGFSHNRMQFDIGRLRSIVQDIVEQFVHNNGPVLEAVLD